MYLEAMKRDKKIEDLAKAYCEFEARLEMLNGVDNEQVMDCLHPVFQQLDSILGKEFWGDFINMVLKIQSDYE